MKSTLPRRLQDEQDDQAKQQAQDIREIKLMVKAILSKSEMGEELNRYLDLEYS
jgi:hypothetical protein